MRLAAGTQLGSYEVLGLIGAGGMGEVYRARDTQLKRDVAIKVLPAQFAADPERVARFHREAQAVAALNHPNIAAIYGLEEYVSTRFLVLELVEGETLAERIHRGPIPINESLNIAKQISEALEAAHEKGVVHRDLKPANVKITPEGKVKVLDFGLAKAMGLSASGSGRGEVLSHSPTLTITGTQAGLILGTAAYMSPEQAKGFDLDHRTDIFSFGSVVYEMITGRQAFDGDSISEVLASVLKTEADLSLLPAKLNPRISDLLRRCLAKNPRARWHASADVRVELETILADPRGLLIKEQDTARRPLWKRAVPVLAAVLLTAAATGMIVWSVRPPAPRQVVKVPIFLGDGQQFTSVATKSIAISPDGANIIYAASAQQLYLRPMSEAEARPIPGTEDGARLPVFSPDGRSVAFFTPLGSLLKKIPLTGGAAETICALETGTVPLGLAWDVEGIVFAESGKGILRVPENGDTPVVLVEVKPPEVAYAPQILPGGQTVLFTLASGTGTDRWEKAKIVVQPLKSGKRKTVIQGGSDARFLSTGHIVYAFGGTLFAALFDLDRLEAGVGVPVVEGVRRTDNPGTSGGTASYSVSDTGSLVYIPGPVLVSSRAGQTLARIDRSGTAKPLNLSPAFYSFPRVSPDGKHIAFGIEDGVTSDIWIYELSGTTQSRRLTLGGANRYPVWSHDSQRLAFQSDREGDLAIFVQRADGIGKVERLTKPDKSSFHVPDSWSRDDRLSFTAGTGNTPSVRILSLKDKQETLFAENAGRSVFSPDGQWLAYQSPQPQAAGGVWVQALVGGAKYQIAKRTATNPHHPAWSPNRKELFYIPGPLKLVAVTIATEAAFAVGQPLDIPTGGFQEGGPSEVRSYDFLPDGTLIGIVPTARAQSGTGSNPRMEVVLNWFEELKQLAPLR